MSIEFPVSTAALRHEERQRLRFEAALILALGAAATVALLLAARPAFRAPQTPLCFEVTPQATDALPAFFGSREP